MREEEEATMALIKQLEEQDKEEVLKLMEGKQEEEEELFKCPVCFEDYEEDNIHPLESCDHVFHEDCLRDYLAQKIQDRAHKFPCP